MWFEILEMANSRASLDVAVHNDTSKVKATNDSTSTTRWQKSLQSSNEGCGYRANCRQYLQITSNVIFLFRTVLREGLKTHFAKVKVNVVECPDLRNEPFHLAAEGLGGRPRILDVGGVPYLTPLIQRDKIYNMDRLAKLAELPGAFLIGAGGGPHHILGVNTEFIANVRTQNGGEAINSSYCSMVDTSKNDSCKLFKLPPNNRDCAMMVNLLATEGKPGKVLEIEVHNRIGQEPSFVDAMRQVLKQHYGEKVIGIGGTFAILQGNAHIHVMPDFSATPLNTPAEVDAWLKFYDMPSPFVCLGVFYSHDPGYALRIEHFHGFSLPHDQGGHYHWDTTPADIHYLGYFNLGEYLYRIDRPNN